MKMTSTVLGPLGADLYTAMDHHGYGNTDIHVCTAVVTWGVPPTLPLTCKGVLVEKVSKLGRSLTE